MAPSSTNRSLIILYRDLLLYTVFTFVFGVSLLLGRGSYGLSSAGNVINQGFGIVVLANSVLLAALYRSKLPELLWVMGWLLPLIAWITVSFYWSAFPDLTIRRAGRELIECVYIVLLISTYSHPTGPLRILFLSFLTILFLDVVSIPFPSFSYSPDPPGFMGIHGHKNSAGGFYFLALPLFVFAIFDRRIAKWPYTAMFASICAVGLLLFSRSKTAIGLFALTTICLIALWTLRWMGKYKGVIALIYILIAAAAAVCVTAAGLADTLDFLTGDPTFTGRVAIWQYVLSRWEDSPYFGQGFGALWQVGAEAEAQLRAAQLNWVMNEAHNGYLDVLAQIGIIGILLLSVLLFSGLLIVSFAREEKSDPLNVWKWFGIYVTLGMLFYNLTESTLVRSGAGDWMVFLAMVTSAVFFRGYSQVANSPFPGRADLQFQRVHGGHL
jgi:exopolysaccharide production protein ExoQ